MHTDCLNLAVVSTKTYLSSELVVLTVPEITRVRHRRERDGPRKSPRDLHVAGT